MEKTLYRSENRGKADHGWLKARHSFSFAGWHNPQRLHFGVLRVLNDDIVAPGRGFDMHPHENMEIITIPLSGSLEHRDDMGNTSMIQEGDVQVMSAGTGVLHSEYNPDDEQAVNLLQIWLFPRERNLTPRYQQKTFYPEKQVNQLVQIISPDQDDGLMWLHQDAWFYISLVEAGNKLEHHFHHDHNGVYLFLISGELEVAGEKLRARDAIGVSRTDKLTIQGLKDSRFLLMEFPMQN